MARQFRHYSHNLTLELLSRFSAELDYWPFSRWWHNDDCCDYYNHFSFWFPRQIGPVRPVEEQQTRRGFSWNGTDLDQIEKRPSSRRNQGRQLQKEPAQTWPPSHRRPLKPTRRFNSSRSVSDRKESSPIVGVTPLASPMTLAKNGNNCELVYIFFSLFFQDGLARLMIR